MTSGDYVFWMPIQVRWADMDCLGHVNNAVFFTYIESARLTFFNHIGLGRYWKDGYGPILAKISCDFRKPIVHPAELQAGVRVARIGNSSMVIETILTIDGRENVVASSEAVVVWVHYPTGKSAPLTEDMRTLLS